MQSSSKKISVIILILIFLAIVCVFRPKTLPCKVIKVNSANEFYVDFNNNSSAEDDELVQMYYVRAFNPLVETSLSTQEESAKLSYLADEFAKKELLNKTVNLKFDKHKRLITVFVNNKDYSKSILDNGLGLENSEFKIPSYRQNPDKIKENIKEADKLNLVSFNEKSKKYHKLNCKAAFLSTQFKILPYQTLIKTDKSAKPCKICHKTNKEKNKTDYKRLKKEKYPREVTEVYTTAYKDSYIELCLSDFTRFYYPSAKCVTTACQSLLREINSAKSSIDFAIYGVSSQTQVQTALLNAQKRGVKVRWVYDLDNHGETIYADTKNLAKVLSNSKPDIFSGVEPSRFSNSIMHNKFFIFDNKKVWAGSANISETDLSGFSANSVLLINSPLIASIYKDEFLQMYNGNFHRKKTTAAKSCVNLASSTIQVYFSPQDKTIENHIIPLVKGAKNYIYMPVFVITHKNLVNELIAAKNRGVDVKIILDSTGASNRYSPVKMIRDSGIKLKVENRPGKMHMKSLIIDDRYAVIGSMNFSKSGESHNDENVIIIQNPVLAKSFKNNFLYLWSKIPDKWLYKNPRAESFDSVNSCFDGIDNDHDGKIDMEDDSCNWKLRKSVKN